MKQRVVIDNGTGYTKLGYAGNESPQFIIPTIVETKTQEILYPIRNGKIQNWDLMEGYWHKCFFDYLQCNTEESFVLLTEPPHNIPENREKIAEIMFETFDVPGIYNGVQAIFSLISAWCDTDTKGSLTGVVVDSGEGVTHIVPVVGGYVIESAIQSIPVAGREATLFMQQLLRERGEESNLKTSQRIKETETYIAEDILKEFEKYENNTSMYKRTETGVFLGYEQFMTPEVILSPEIVRRDCVFSLAEMINITIQKCPIDSRRSLYSNIVLSGGTTLFSGFSTRLKKDLENVVSKKENYTQETKPDVSVISHKKQQHAVWSGGSLFASMDMFENYCIKKEDYFEQGSVICRKSNVFNELFV